MKWSNTTWGQGLEGKNGIKIEWFQRPESKFVDDSKLRERPHYIVARESKGKRKCCKECISSSWAVHLHRINSSSNHGTFKLSAWEIEVLKISQGCNTSPSWCVREMKWVVSCSIDDWHQTGGEKKINEARILRSCCRDFCGKVCTKGSVPCLKHVRNSHHSNQSSLAYPRSREGQCPENHSLQWCFLYKF